MGIHYFMKGAVLYLTYNSNSTLLFCPLPVSFAFEATGLVLLNPVVAVLLSATPLLNKYDFTASARLSEIVVGFFSTPSAWPPILKL